MSSGSKERRPAMNEGRHLARVIALFGVYQWLTDPTQDYAAIEPHLGELFSADAEEGAEASADDSREVIEGSGITARDLAKADRPFARQLLAGVIDQHAAITEALQKHIDRGIERVSLVERAALMIGAYELMHCPETPWLVILNEAVELAKQYGSGYRFTNAVLEKVARDVRPEETASAKA